MVLSAHTAAASRRQPIEIAALVGRRDVAMAVTCLGSLADASADPVVFRIHDDGTLLDDDKACLVSRLPGCTFVDRASADEEMETRLRRYPASRGFRTRQVLGLKLFDVPLLSSGEAVAFCDSDILFLRPFCGLFEFPDSDCGCIFMQDWQEAYALRPWQLAPLGQVSVPRKLNSGLFYLRLRAYDLDFIEWMIARGYEVFSRLPSWLEQTCWGALALRSGGRYWDRQQICVVRSMKSLSDATVGAHFTSSVRGLLVGAAHHVRRDLAPEPVQTAPMRRLSAVQLAADQASRFIRTRITDR